MEAKAAMLTLTDRYEVDGIVPLCEGWQFGLGYDRRLQRPVLVTLIPQEMANQFWFQQWLQKRSGISHVSVAEFLDGDRVEDYFLCVFSRQESSRIGLPPLGRGDWYEAAQSLIAGSQVLSAVDNFHVNEWQVLWDGTHPRLLGLPVVPSLLNGTGRFGNHSVEVARYILQMIEREVSFNNDAHPISPSSLQVGVNRLEELAASDECTFESLAKLISTLQAAGNLVQEDHDGTEEESEDEPEKIVTASPLRGWLFLALVVVVVFAGFVWWFGRKPSLQNKLLTTSPAINAGIAMPGLQGFSASAAVHKLEMKGVAASRIQLVPQTSSSPAGAIISTVPNAGQAIMDSRPVILRVSVPDGGRLAPDLVGRSLQAAANELLAKDIHFAYVYKNAPQADQGKVIAQTPAAYSVITPGTQVHFVVATHY